MSPNTFERIVLPANKVKLLLALLACIAFVYVGYELYNIDDPSSKYNSPYVKTVAIAAIIFSCAGMISGVQKLFIRKLELIIDEKGITDNINGVGLIKWKDITEFRARQEHSVKYLLVILDNPDKYISKAGFARKRLMQWNMASYGTPISLNALSLKCDFNYLHTTLLRYLQEFGTDAADV